MLQLSLSEKGGKGSPLYCIPTLWHGRAVLQLSLSERIGKGVTSLLYSCSLARLGGAPADSLRELLELERGSPLYCIPALWHGWAVLQLSLSERSDNAQKSEGHDQGSQQEKKRKSMAITNRRSTIRKIPKRQRFLIIITECFGKIRNKLSP